MAAKGKAQDESQPAEGQAPQGEQAAQAPEQGAAAPAEQAGAEGAEQGGDGEPAHSRGGANKSGASPKAPGKAAAASPKVTPATLAARQAQVFAAPALGAPMHEKHLGLVNRKGEKVVLDDVVVKDVPSGSTYRATEVIYEETSVPGADNETRRRILFGKDAVIPELEFRELRRRVQERTATLEAEESAEASKSKAK